jgi:hypothetical protein
MTFAGLGHTHNFIMRYDVMLNYEYVVHTTSVPQPSDITTASRLDM